MKKYFLILFALVILSGVEGWAQLNNHIYVNRGETTYLKWQAAGDYSAYDSLYFAVKPCTSLSCGRLSDVSKSTTVSYTEPYTTITCTLYAANTSGLNAAKYYYSIYAYGSDTVLVTSGDLNLQLNGQTVADGTASTTPVHILAVDSSQNEPSIYGFRNSDNSVEQYTFNELVDSSYVLDSLSAHRALIDAFNSQLTFYTDYYKLDNLTYTFGNDTLLFSCGVDTANTAGTPLSLYLTSGTYTQDADSGIYFSGSSNIYRFYQWGWGGNMGNTPVAQSPLQSLEQDADWAFSFDWLKLDSSAAYRFWKTPKLTYMEAETNGDVWLTWTGGNWTPITSTKRYKNVFYSDILAKDNSDGATTFAGQSTTLLTETTSIPISGSASYMQIPHTSFNGWIKNINYYLKGTIDSVIYPMDSVTIFVRYGTPTITTTSQLGTVKITYEGDDEYQIVELLIEGNLPSDFRSYPINAIYQDYELSGDVFWVIHFMNNNQLVGISDTSSTDVNWTYYTLKRNYFYYPNTRPTSGADEYDYVINPQPSQSFQYRIIAYVKNGYIKFRNMGLRYLK